MDTRSLQSCPAARYESLDFRMLAVVWFLQNLLALFSVGAAALIPATNDTPYWRPLVHFTPQRNWINDPNGLVYDPVHEVYHLFGQYNPGGDQWGNMSWLHAQSVSLIEWKELPVAIYTSTDIAIFSGSAVLDGNTSGLCPSTSSSVSSAPPVCMVCIWAGNGLGKQTINLASSVDPSFTQFVKFRSNPVIDIQSANFRDPSVFFYSSASGTRLTHPPAEHSREAPVGYWLATIAHSDLNRVEFYRSDDLIHWQLLSSFGPQGMGSGWECPDLFSLPVLRDNQPTGKTLWVLTVSVEGTPGSYFAGEFNGSAFTALSTQPALPIDVGLDFYASISYSNLPDGRIVSIGWMSNWEYAAAIPTSPWRGAYTIPRSLTLHAYGEQIRMQQLPVSELLSYHRSRVLAWPGDARGGIHTGSETLLRINRALQTGMRRFDLSACFSFPATARFGFFLRANPKHTQYTTVGFNFSAGQEGGETASALVFVDRTHSGMTSFAPTFSSIHTVALQLTDLYAVNSSSFCVRVLVDSSSVELFVQQGLVALTELIFPIPQLGDDGVQVWVETGDVSLQSMDAWNLDVDQKY